MNSSSEKLSKLELSHSKDMKEVIREEQNGEQTDNIQDKTQVSVKKYYIGSEHYKIIIKIKMVPYESKLTNPFLSIENIDLKTIVVRNKPDLFKVHNKAKFTRDITNLSKDKVLTFDWVFGDNENSEFMDLKSFQLPVQRLLKGYNQSLLLYGGANSGKTHLTIGSLRDPGLIILLIKEVLYSRIELEEQGINVKIKMSLCQFNEDKFYDCIIGHSTPLEVHEDSQKQLYIAGLYEAEVQNLIQAMRIIKIAQLHLQKYEQNIDKSKQLLKSTNIIFEIKCIQDDLKNIDKKQIVSSLKLVKFEQETFHDAIRGEQNSVLAPLNNCFRLISEINQKTRKENKIPYKSHKLIEYLRDCIGGNSETYIIGCANPLVENMQDTEAMIRNLNMAKSITTTPEIIKYSNQTQDYQLEQYQKSIRDNIQGWTSQFFGEQGTLSQNQQERLQTIGNILSKVQQYLNKLIKIYTDVQDSQTQVQVIYQQIVDNMSKAYTKCITSSDVKEFYIGKLQQYHIDSFKEINASHYQIIEMLLNKLYKSKMKAEIWEFQLVQHLKLKELRVCKPDNLQSKDVEKLVQISKQSKKLYQYFNEQVCLSQFDSAKSQQLLNTLFSQIQHIKTISNVVQIPTLQQINSSQFIEIRRRDSQLSSKNIDESTTLATEAKFQKQSLSYQKSSSLRHQLSRIGGNTNRNQILSIFQSSRKDYNKDSFDILTKNEGLSLSDNNSGRKKNLKSQFLIMNMLDQETQDYGQYQENQKVKSKDNISLSSQSKLKTNEGEEDNDKELEEYVKDKDENIIVDLRKLQQKYAKIKKRGGETTKNIYVNNKKIEVKKNNSYKTKRYSINSQDKGKGNLHESIHNINVNDQLLSQDQSLLLQIASIQTANEDVLKGLIGNQLQSTNQSNLNANDNYSSINQLLQIGNETQLYSNNRVSQSINQNHSDTSHFNYQNSNSQSGYQNRDSPRSKLQNKGDQNKSQILNLPNLSELLDNQVNAQNEWHSQVIRNMPNDSVISLNASNHTSMLGGYIQTNPLQQIIPLQTNQNELERQVSIKALDDLIRNKNNKVLNDSSLLSIPAQLELDNDLLNEIFQKSKKSHPISGQQLKQLTHFNGYKNTTEEYQTQRPLNLSSLITKKYKENSQVQIREKYNDNLLTKLNKMQLKFPLLNQSLASKKQSLISLRGYKNEYPQLDDKQIGYFRTQLKQTNNSHSNKQQEDNDSKNNNKIDEIKEIIIQITGEQPTSSYQINQNLSNKKKLSPEFSKEIVTALKINKSFSHIKSQNYENSYKKNIINQSLEKLEKNTSTNEKHIKQSKIKELHQSQKITFKLPNIIETLKHRSKYTKFFLN